MKQVMRLVLVLFSLILLVPSYICESDSTLESYNRYVNRMFVAPISSTIKELRCLTQALYYEAGTQSALGKEAVAMVIINRAQSRKHPGTICGVVREQSTVIVETEDSLIKRKVCQFSFWCQADIDSSHMKTRSWKESEEISKRVLKNYWERDIIRSLGGAMYFHADYVNPTWRTEKVFLGKVGRHLFYAERTKLT